MLPPDVLNVFRDQLAGLSNQVVVEYFGSGESSLTVPGRTPVPCPRCPPTREMLEEIAATSDRVELRIHDVTTEPQLAAELGVDQVPGIVFRGHAGGRLRLFGLPDMNFMPVLLDGMRHAGRPAGDLPAEIAAILEQFEGDLNVRVIATVTHPASGQAAASAFELASLSDRVTAAVYSMESFPQLVRDLQMTHAPLTFVNDARGFAGAAEPGELARFALESQRDRTNARPPKIAPGSVGEVTRTPPRGAPAQGLAVPRGSGPAAPPVPAPQPSATEATPDVPRADVAVIGGGPGGLQAALLLARARRSVAVFDDPAPPRNAASHGLHGFLGLEGLRPEEVRRMAWEQINHYEGAVLDEQRVAEIARTADDEFLITTDEGDQIAATQVILAIGHSDVFPEIPGFAECWGESIVPCVLCDGYEHRDRVWGIVRSAVDAPTTYPFMALHWTDRVHFIQGGSAEISATESQRLVELGVQLHKGAVVAIAREGAQVQSVTLYGGEEIEIETLLWMPPTEPDPLVARLVENLGIVVDPRGNVATNQRQETNVKGLWAIGDVKGWTGALAAAAQGHVAASQMLLDWHG